MHKAMWVLVTLVSLGFLYIDSVKVTGRPQAMIEFQMTAYFIPFGLNRQIALMIGLAENFGGITIRFHRKHWIGLVSAATLVVVTSGALTFHLIFDTFREDRAVFMMLLLSAVILIVSGRRYAREGKESGAPCRKLRLFSRLMDK